MDGCYRVNLPLFIRLAGVKMFLLSRGEVRVQSHKQTWISQSQMSPPLTPAPRNLVQDREQT